MPCLNTLAAKLFQTLPPLTWSVGKPRRPQQRRRRTGTCSLKPAASDACTGGAPYCKNMFYNEDLVVVGNETWPRRCRRLHLGVCVWPIARPGGGLSGPDQRRDLLQGCALEMCGISPLMVTCWACFMHRLSPKDLARVQGLSPLTVMRAVDQLRATEQMSPSPARLFGHLPSDSINRKR